MNSLSAISPVPAAEKMIQLADQVATGRVGGGKSVAAPDVAGGDFALPGTATTQPTGSSFESTLGRMVSEVNSKQVAASNAVAGLMNGQQVPLHQAVIAMEEASVSFQLMVEIRNKLLESYQELMRMQV